MNRSLTRLACLAGALVALPLLAAGPAQAQPGAVHFSMGGLNCAIFDNGTVGCDLPTATPLQYGQLPFAIPVHEIVMDIPWLPAHPTFDSGTPYTLPGGNPPIDQVKTGDGQWGPFVEHAGVHCYVGFHGSVGCTAGGRGWSMWSGRISA
ncbi:hypothetical protein [Nocardia farcinica]|uniref:hypothetical protein n=1 Tax=Nocardia farcinica TaxID=37329 RepID=UPI000A37D6E1|nr:hypothetical protein [Nocardia farcinica]MBF6536752.1 hypothetical protein [Nocardia farcinica]